MTEEEKKEEKAEKAKGTDYTDPKSKRKTSEKSEDKNVEKVVTGAVIVKKRGVGKKIKDVFVAADLRSVMGYVTYEVMIPAAKNMIVETAIKGVERLFGVDNRFRRGGPLGPQGQGIVSRYSYNAPVQRERDSRPGVLVQSGPSRRSDRPEFFLSTRDEANLVLETMYDVLNVHESVLVSELNTMLDLESTYTDEQWGWTDLRGSKVREVRGIGWTIDLPKPEPIH